MADYNTLESSVESSRPAELYRLVIGNEAPILYTSSEDTITIDANVYLAETITRNNVVQGPDDRSRSLEVSLPADNPFALRFLGIVPGQRATCTVLAIQRDETPSVTTKQVFHGHVRGVRFPGDGSRAIIGVKSIESATARSLPRITYQALCNHSLYDARCGKDPALFQHVGLVTLVAGSTVTVTGCNAYADGWFNAGFVKPAGIEDFRMVRRHVGNVLTLLLPFPSTILNQTISVYAGCNHLIDGDCDTKFNNVSEHGGFAFISLTNPFESGL